MQRLAILSAIGLAVSCGPAFAIDLACREFRSLVISDEIKRPKPPYCATSAISFFDEYQLQSCRSEMLDYQAKMERYGKCLQRENSEAVAEFNETVESFNQLASR